MVVVYLQKAERGGLDVYKTLAARLNKAGEACRKAGLTLAYHPHAFEYEVIDGVRPIDLMLKETDPKHLHPRARHLLGQHRRAGPREDARSPRRAASPSST